MKVSSKISPCLWFDDQAEAAAKFYTSIFKNSRIVKTSYFTAVGQEFHGRPPGSVMTVELELATQSFTLLNGGPLFKFSEAISLQISCETQEEVDDYWTKLTADGGEESQCGWLKDKFGVSWQVVPTICIDLITDPDPKRSDRAREEMFRQQKPDIAAMLRAADG